MHKAWQEPLCTEPESNPEEALFISVAFEEGLKRRASNGNCELEVKSELISVCATPNTGQFVFNAEPITSHCKIFPSVRQWEENVGNADLRDILTKIVGNSRIEEAIPLNKLLTQLGD